MDLITLKHLTFLGLCFDVLGALLILSGVFVTKRKAIEIGISRICGDDDEDNLKLPSVANLINQSKTATLGTLFLMVGFILQACGAWPF